MEMPCTNSRHTVSFQEAEREVSELNDGLSFEYKGCIFREIHKTEMNKYFNFRYRIFCQELGWVPQNEKKLEKDRYDKLDICIHFGSFLASGKIVGCMRFILPSAHGWMLHNELKDFFGKSPVPECRNNAVELTRLGIDKQVRNLKSIIILTGFLKIGYQWSIQHEISKWYFVTSKKFVLLLQRLGFSASIIGEGLHDINNVFTVPGVVNLRESAKQLKRKNLNQF